MPPLPLRNPMILPDHVTGVWRLKTLRVIVRALSTELALLKAEEYTHICSESVTPQAGKRHRTVKAI